MRLKVELRGLVPSSPGSLRVLSPQISNQMRLQVHIAAFCNAASQQHLSICGRWAQFTQEPRPKYETSLFTFGWRSEQLPKNRPLTFGTPHLLIAQRSLNFGLVGGAGSSGFVENISQRIAGLITSYRRTGLAETLYGWLELMGLPTGLLRSC